MTLITQFVRKMAGGVLARLWHRFAPSFAIKKRFFGTTLFLDFRDNFDAFLTSDEDMRKREWPVMEIPEKMEGMVWDIGANLGYLSVRAASAGRAVVSFELSTRAIELLEKTRSANDLSFEIVPRAFLAENVSYTPPTTSWSGNKAQIEDEGSTQSITFQEAEAQFGTPALIKMDIEGAEEAFFEHAEWKQWLIDHKILWIVEVHAHMIGHTPIWEDVPHIVLPSTHYVYCSDESKLDFIKTTFEL